MDHTNECLSCGGDRGNDGTSTTIICQYCGTQWERPTPEGILIAETAPELPVPPPPADPQWVVDERKAIDECTQQQTGRLMRILLSVFLLILPGVAIAIAGGITAGMSNNYSAMAIRISFGVVVAASGILSVIFHAIALKKVTKQLRSRIAQLQSHGFSHL